MTPEEVLESLIAIVAEEGQVEPAQIGFGPGSLRDLGLSSLTHLRILVAIEDAFGIEWDDNVDETILSDLHAMRDHLVGLLGAHA
ncbi:acyl carrier protein [Nocardia niigatensis]|uniref:acyl carrier protein n=1 Tax=Nocardia niigatensis TaxID=209249 RepID=UPI000315A86F|nr:phosphopantetheine-binding protein [Nocardia niigatensis]